MGACVQGRARGVRHMRVRGACPRACLQAWMCTGTCMRVCARVFECECTRLGVCVCARVFERVRAHTRVHVRSVRVCVGARSAPAACGVPPGAGSLNLTQATFRFCDSHVPWTLLS